MKGLLYFSHRGIYYIKANVYLVIMPSPKRRLFNHFDIPREFVFDIFYQLACYIFVKSCKTIHLNTIPIT